MSVVKVVVVGAGWWSANHHLPALLAHPNAEVVAVCDPVAGRAEALAQRAGCPAFAGVEQALQTTSPDAAVISTPHVTHHALGAAAIGAGLHVLMEKPLALTAAEAFDLVNRAENAGVQLSVGYTHQFDPSATFARAAVQSDIGMLLQVTVEYSSRAGRLFAAAQGARREYADSEPGAPHPETYSLGNGGGQAHTQLTHALGMLCWSTGDDVAEIAAFSASRALDVDVDDAAAFRLRGGATGVVIGSGDTGANLPPRQHIRYHGTTGIVEHDLYRARVRLHRHDGSMVVREPGQHEPAYRAGEPARAFIDLLSGRGTNLGPPGPAAAAVATVEALLESGRASGRPIVVAALQAA
ncbi:Gfo/Idh/MocA family protein [Phytoactinopolyspora halotolerans]|uniref:Gfo/Idh/MocA family oxidoreductase n=1 Tax=Phytoactinopolyspora halotolerans TaxID=1981512 RepID=A0A6L9SHX2_9ACTN|nr:Gfo/Idh/MocA family oxidoreductase [Phytoactinopolyspora halotolerans]NEE04717.1 Gfo/Idh/MocA family oxidoreductase [Phytoactinopolyspora halotolerans]